jgi:tetratricopeptide (TPR) repeat protein
MRKNPFAASLTVLLLAAGLLAGCTRDPNVRKQKYLESGDRFLAKARYREAAIQYQNALQVDSQFVDAHYQLAQAYLKLNIWSSAAQELNRVLLLNPKHVKAHIDMGNLLLAARQFNAAQDHAHTVLSEDPNNVDAHVLLANSYAALEHLPDSLEEMQKAISLAPDRPRSYLNLAFLQMGSQQIAEAEQSFKKALELDPKSINALISLGNFYQQQRRWPDAEQEYRKAMQVEPANYLPVAALARMLVVESKRPDAEQLLKEAKTNLHDNPDGYRLLGDLYFGLGEVDKATAEFASLHHEYPKDKRVKRDYVQLLILGNRLEEAGKLNEEILKDNDKDVDALVASVQILFRQGKTMESAQVLEAALISDPDNAVAQYHMGIAAGQLGNMPRAERALREAARLRPNMPAAHQALAAVAIRKNDLDLLTRSAEALVKLEPQAASGYVLRALAKVSGRNPAGAEEDLRRAMVLAPDDPTAYSRLATIRASQRKYPEAEKLYEQALTKNPKFIEPVQGLMGIYFVQKQPARAIARVNEQIRKVPDSSALYFMLAQALMQTKDLEKSEAAAQKAVELDKNNVEAFLLLAQAQVARGHADQAMQNYESTMKSNPLDVRPYVLMGMLLESRRDTKRAQEFYQKALQVQPDYPLAANNLAYLMVETGGSLDVALSLAETARRGMPDLPSVADTLAWVYYHKGAYGLAIDLLQEAVKKMPDNPTFHYHLGMVYQKTKDNGKAREHLQRTLQLNPNYENATAIRQALSTLGG